MKPQKNEQSPQRAKITARVLARIYGTTPRQIRAWHEQGAPLTDLDNIADWFNSRHKQPEGTMKLLSDNQYVAQAQDELNEIAGFCLTSAWYLRLKLESALVHFFAFKRALDHYTEADGDRWEPVAKLHKKQMDAFNALDNKLWDIVEMKRVRGEKPE